MSKIILVFFYFLFSAQVQQQSFTLLDEDKSVQFIIQNFGFEVKGSFTGLTGIITFDENDLSNAVFQASVSAAKINTNNTTRDKHLKGADYFDVLKYPIIKINSTKILKSATPGYYVFYGQLTIKQKTANIIFPFTVTNEKNGLRFKGDFKVKRKDFNLGGNSTISNELIVKLSILAKRN